MYFASWDQVAARLAQLRAQWVQWGPRREAIYYSPTAKLFIVIYPEKTPAGTRYAWSEQKNCNCGR